MKYSFREKMEDNDNPYVRVARIIILILIVIGFWMIFNQDVWLLKVVEYLV